MTTTQNTSDALKLIRNRTFDELAVGDTVSMERTLNSDDIALFAIMSGDVNPTHVDPEYARSSSFREVVAHGMWGGTLISTVLGTQFQALGRVHFAPPRCLDRRSCHRLRAAIQWRSLQLGCPAFQFCSLHSPPPIFVNAFAITDS